MASRAVITIRVTSARGGSTVQYTTKGKYISFLTNGYQRLLRSQPIQSTASLEGFWVPILNTVVADITAHPTPP
jgi:hypothetical protein